MLKICPSCHKTFTTFDRNTQCCSKKCTSKAKKVLATKNRIMESWAIGDQSGVTYWHGGDGKEDNDKKNLRYWNKIKKKKKKLHEDWSGERVDTLIKHLSAYDIYSFISHIWREGKFSRSDMKKLADAIIDKDETGQAIYSAGLTEYWGRYFDYEKALKKLKTLKYWGRYFDNYSPLSWYDSAISNWPRGISDIKGEISYIKRNAKKMPKTPFKLKEGYQDMEADGISYWNSPDWKFDTDQKALRYWNGLKKKKKRKPSFGLREDFNYNNISSERLWTAGIKVSMGIKSGPFDYDKALEVLRNRSRRREERARKEREIYWDDNAYWDTYWYKKALREWPKSKNYIIKQTERLKSKSDKMPKKPFGLKEDSRDEEEWVFRDTVASNIYDTGRSHPNIFDFEKGLDELIKQPKEDGADWYILLAGKWWEHFNYGKGLKALKDMNSLYLDNAYREWPRGTEEVKQASQKIKHQSEKMPKKPFGLKEDLWSLGTDRSPTHSGISYWSDSDSKMDNHPPSKVSDPNYFETRVKQILKLKKKKPKKRLKEDVRTASAKIKIFKKVVEKCDDPRRFAKEGQFPRITKNYYRFRQIDPNSFIKSSFRILKSASGNARVIGRTKDGKSRTQSILIAKTNLSDRDIRKFLPLVMKGK